MADNAVILTADSRTFRVKAVIKYHRDVGVFPAASPEAALLLAEQSDAFTRISDRSPGGIYDLEVEEITNAK